MNARTAKLPVIKNTKITNSAPAPMLKIGSNRFLRATLRSKFDHTPTIAKMIHVAMNQGVISGCGVISLSRISRASLPKIPAIPALTVVNRRYHKQSGSGRITGDKGIYRQLTL